VRNIGTVLKLLAAAFLVGGLVSCSSPKTQNSKHLTEAIDKAQRLSQRAIALMANPYYTQKSTGVATPFIKRPAGSQVGPFLKIADEAVTHRSGLEKESTDMEIGGIDAVHPEAIKDLEFARTDLEKAINADAEADVSVMALAKSTQANILKVEAQYYWAMALTQNDKVSPAMETAKHQLDLAQACAKSIDAAEKVVALDAKDTQKFFDEETGVLAALNKEIATKKEQIAAITAQIQELLATTAKQQTETATLEAEAREAFGDKALEITDKIAALRQDACAKTTQMKDLELQRQQLRDRVAVLTVQIATTQVQVTIAQDAVQAKKGVMDSNEKTAHQAQDGLTKAREAALPALKDAFAAYAAWEENAKKVSTYLDLALKTPGNPRDAHAMAEQGAMEMDLGAVNAELGAGAARMKQQRQELERIWNQKAGTSMIGGGAELPAVSGGEAEGYLKAAADAFKKARDAYNSATRDLPNGLLGQNIAWVYQASEAKAWRSLAAVSADDAGTAIPSAERLEGLAKEGRENSPYLKNVDTPVATK
jgi:hypothetical protein